ncbi:MFS transporter [Bradyrhizobium uaiense]|uniref:MFS transporter n=1 Tax=Bradyrhizobium uaiense TaxID=2594946 RepID=UPI003D316BA6
MTHQSKLPPSKADGILTPLGYPTFRRLWLPSLLTNLGILVQGVGAACAMTQMMPSADQVALVPTALMLPVMLIAMPAGAIVGLVALCGAIALTVLDWLGLTTPNFFAGALLSRRQRHCADGTCLAILSEQAGALRSNLRPSR